MPILTDVRHELFARAVAEGAELAEAYEQAGFQRHEGNASRLRANEKVRARIDELMKEAAILTGVTIERLCQELAGIALFDAGDVIEWGTDDPPKRVGRRRPGPKPNRPVDLTFVRLHNSKELPATTRRALAKVKKTRYGIEVQPHDKIAAIRLLGSHLGMWKDSKDEDKASADALIRMIDAAHKKAIGEQAKVIDGETGR